MQAETRRTIETPIGRLEICADSAGVRAIGRVVAASPSPAGDADAERVLDEAASQLAAYFAGELTAFDLPLAAEGTPFQRAVWDELCRIPFGRVISYRELSERVGCVGGARAVGGANSKNPIAIVVPCHRVVGSSGRMVGYAGGLDMKEALLEHERAKSGLFAGAGR